MNLFFFLSRIYNIWLKERYGDDLLTHSDLDLDLWLEAGSSGKFDRNRVYGLYNTMAKNLRMAHGILTVGCSQTILSTQTSEFTVMLDQRVQAQMVHLNEKCERLTTYY
jgi:hypothetical protein